MMTENKMTEWLWFYCCQPCTLLTACKMEGQIIRLCSLYTKTLHTNNNPISLSTPDYESPFYLFLHQFLYFLNTQSKHEAEAKDLNPRFCLRSIFNTFLIVYFIKISQWNDSCNGHIFQCKTPLDSYWVIVKSK